MIDIKTRLESKNFDAFFKTTLKDLKPLELKRKDYSKKVNPKIISIFFLSFVLSVISGFWVPSAKINFINVYIAIISMIIILIFIKFQNKFITEYKKLFETHIFNKFISFIGNFKIIPVDAARDKNIINTAKITNFLNSNINILYKLAYKDTDNEIINIIIFTRYNNLANNNYNGILIRKQIKKFYSNNTYIFPQYLLPNLATYKASTGNKNFDFAFDVYTSDKDEALSILTPELITNLMQAKNINLSIEKNCINILYEDKLLTESLNKLSDINSSLTDKKILKTALLNFSSLFEVFKIIKIIEGSND